MTNGTRQSMRRIQRARGTSGMTRRSAAPAAWRAIKGTNRNAKCLDGSVLDTFGARSADPTGFFSMPITRGGVAVGTCVSSHAPRPDPYVRLSRIRLVWGFRCQGCVHRATFRAVASFFCLTRAASILPSRPHITIAVARSEGQGRRLFSAAEGLSLTNASGGRLPAIG
jgi:hypothetical protein